MDINQTFKIAKYSGSVFALLTLSACASLATRLPEISASALNTEQVRQENIVFKDITQYTSRLHKVAAPILTANTELCKKTRPVIGVQTHTVKNYTKSLRKAAQRELGATKIPQISYIAPNSPAVRVGLKRGDILLSPKGKPVARFDKAVTEPDQDGPQTFAYRRNDMDYFATVTPVQNCAYSVRLSSSPAINAYADGSNITVTTGMMDFVNSDSELALIVGHELAHNTMGHIRKIIGNLILSGLSTKYTRPFESEADYIGMYYMARAGYNIENVEDVWRRLARINTKSVARAKTHPTYSNRYLGLAATRAEIKQKRRNNEDILPNFLEPRSDTTLSTAGS